MSSPVHALTEHTTSFVGRASEVAEILSLLADPYCRLLTLVGPGGSGKTRLALATAEAVMQKRETGPASPMLDDVCFVPLQGVSSPDQVASAIAAALEWPDYRGDDPEAELLAYLADKRLLLVLDNFEHLLPAAPLILDMLHSSPESKVMVTSRTQLNLADEWLFQVHGLSLPPDGNGERVDSSDAMNLFVERARRMRHDFSLPDEQAHVVRICRMVEGMPLAIELAAAWLRRMSCVEIAEQIESGLDVLASDQMGIPERHRSMRTVFDGSWDLLSDEERAALMALSVFRGGFAREAAASVAGATLPVLSALVDHSQLRVSADGRYSVHELQRQYAAEQLAERPAHEQQARDRHSRYYLDVVSQPVDDFVGEGGKQLVQDIAMELDNVLAAWYWALENDLIPELHGAMESLYWFAWLSTYHALCEQAVRAAVDALRDGPSDELHRIAYASALVRLGEMNMWLGEMEEAGGHLQESVAILREYPGARSELNASLSGLGWLMAKGPEVETARAILLETVRLDHETQDLTGLGFHYGLLGDLAYREADYAQGERWYRQELELGRENDDQRSITDALRALGTLALYQGERERARQYLEEALAVAQDHEIASFEVGALHGLGDLAVANGDLAAASGYFGRAMEVLERWGKRHSDAAYGPIRLAGVRAWQGNYAAASDLYDRVAPLLHQIGRQKCDIAFHYGAAELAILTDKLADAQRSCAECLALAQQGHFALDICRARIGLARVAIRHCEFTEGRRMLLAALQDAVRIDLTPLLLECVAAAAELYAAQDDGAYAAQLAALARDHPASTAQTKQQADALLEQVAPALAPDTLDRVVQVGTETDVAAVANRLVADLIQALDAQDRNRSHEQPLAEPLSDRELQVLRLVADGRSNREIGCELYVALGTVKAHLHHIYRKLDVQSRTQAIARATDLRLL